mmetsp:Transcript_476/g.922  ORF Transcript_476/g.922 Transcript_476/m.922 type:complete len:84 (+) Transcript_476:862-1113(+)
MKHMSPKAESLFDRCDVLLQTLPSPVEEAKTLNEGTLKGRSGGPFYPSHHGPQVEERKKELLREAIHNCSMQVKALNEDATAK